MTVKELINQLLECPMSANVELEVKTDDNRMYSSADCEKVIHYREGAVVLEGVERMTIEEIYKKINHPSCKTFLNAYRIGEKDGYEKGRNDAIDECARIIENSKTLFENHQTECVMLTKDKCIAMIRNLKEQMKGE